MPVSSEPTLLQYDVSAEAAPLAGPGGATARGHLLVSGRGLTGEGGDTAGMLGGGVGVGAGGP